MFVLIFYQKPMTLPHQREKRKNQSYFLWSESMSKSTNNRMIFLQITEKFTNLFGGLKYK